MAKNSQYICMTCSKSCSHVCANCGNPLCTACGMKEMDCKSFACPECSIPVVCQPTGVPHMHGYPCGSADGFCTCQKCAKHDSWHVDEKWKRDSERNVICPVSNIVIALMKREHTDSIVDLFSGGCRCSPSCQPKVGCIQFCGDNKQKHEAAWQFGFDCAAHDWEERHRPNSSAPVQRRRKKMK